MTEKKIIVFDIDNTLTESRSAMDEVMVELFCRLLSVKKVAIVSGGAFHQFDKQIIGHLLQGCNLSNLYLFPTKGGEMYEYKDNNWIKIYEEKLSLNDRQKIREAFEKVLGEVDFIPNESYGDKLQDRETQFTFSALGEDAPTDLKKAWDPDFAKRQILKKELDVLLPEFDIGIGGSTSIDISKKGIDKAYAIRKIMEYLKLTKEEILFIGDAIFPGGNDYPAVSTGVECIKVKDYHETEDVIRKILEK